MTLIPSEIITVYTHQKKDDISEVVKNFEPEKYKTPKDSSNRHVRNRLLLSFCENLKHSPSRCKNTEIAMEWLLQILLRASAPGMDISGTDFENILLNKKIHFQNFEFKSKTVQKISHRKYSAYLQIVTIKIKKNITILQNFRN